MRLSPNVWGPLFWHTMHITALGYPQNPSYAHKRAAKEFFESFTQLLPCPQCREHYAKMLQAMPISPHLDRREDLFRWTVAIHNEVNVRLGKQRILETEAIAFYRRIGARDRSPVIGTDELQEIDMRSMVKGAFIGAGLVLGAGGLLWLSSKGKDSN